MRSGKYPLALEPGQQGGPERALSQRNAQRRAATEQSV
jgi:hypothetical protein